MNLAMQFANPLVLVLLFASVVSSFVGELVNAGIIVVIVSLSVTVNFVQTFRSQRAADRLRTAAAPLATALRDGAFVEVPRASLVPGDVARLAAGDLVPADARLLVSKDLHLRQSALTGESMPVEKEAAAGDESDATTVWLGTSVVSGTFLVVAVGVALPYSPLAGVLGFLPGGGLLHVSRADAGSQGLPLEPSSRPPPSRAHRPPPVNHDSGSTKENVDPAVAPPAAFVGTGRVELTPRHALDLARVDTQPDEVRSHGARSTIAERHVVGVAAAGVCAPHQRQGA